MKESTRVNGMLGCKSCSSYSCRYLTSTTVALDRKALKPFTFSDGTCIPTGTFMCCATGPAHVDEENYPDPMVFNGFRFSESAKSEDTRRTWVTTNVDYFGFGYGRHSWYGPAAVVVVPCAESVYCSPGRFFAANELKAIMAHVLVTYDIKFEDEGVRPPNTMIHIHRMPDRHAKVMFRKRAT
jgi:hypothetical protein